jgi:hypothetical protein
MPAPGLDMSFLPVAEGDLVQLVIWIVIFLFYGLAQLLQKGKKGGNRQAPPRPRPAPASPRDELREFLESLATSAEVETEEEPVFELPPEPRPLVRPVAPPPPAHHKRERPRVEPPRPQPRPEPAPAFARAPAHRPEPPRAWATEAQRKDVKHYTHSTVSAKAFMVSTRGLKMPSLHVRTARSPHATQANATKPALRGRQALKQAMVHHIVLGPPRGLKEDWIFSS